MTCLLLCLILIVMRPLLFLFLLLLIFYIPIEAAIEGHKEEEYEIYEDDDIYNASYSDH